MFMPPTRLLFIFLLTIFPGETVDKNYAGNSSSTRKTADREKIPENFIKVSGNIASHALLVEKSSQTLYHYEIGKKPRLRKSYFCSTGERPGKKVLEGDLRTPEGVYFFTNIMEQDELHPKYGIRAFVTDYPNDFDVLSGKNGYGIWMHGSDLPDRVMLPWDTEGCIVLSNQDLKELSSFINLSETPIIIVKKIKYLSPEERESFSNKLDKFLSAWESAWESKNLDSFMDAYSENFRSSVMNWHQLRAHKKKLNETYDWIDVTLEDITWIGGEEQIVANFVQFYDSNIHSDVGKKRLYLHQVDGKWKILGEYWEPLTSRPIAEKRGDH